MIRIKICGITDADDAEAAIAAGADTLGFVLWAPSPRACRPEVAAAIVRELGHDIETVGVFVDEDPAIVDRRVRECRLDRAQLHGSEDEATTARLTVPWIQAFRAGPDAVATIRRIAPRRFLLDAFRPGMPGGTGETFDWSIAREVRGVGELHLAGGLSPENVASALTAVRPAGVDASSALEISPGRKDPARLREFVAEVRRWERDEAGSSRA